jgi:uncharacterized protein YndB with AHSA1/START domain
MTVVSTATDPEALTLTIVAEFDAPAERVWQVWEDPRLLERWWGPPTWPATFTTHQFMPGGAASYYMTGPDGEQAHGWWTFTAIDPPRRLEFDDGFADQDGNPVADMGSTHAVVTFEPVDGRTRMKTTSRFESAEQLERMLAMGMEEGIQQAMGQIDGLLTGAPDR